MSTILESGDAVTIFPNVPNPKSARLYLKIGELNEIYKNYKRNKKSTMQNKHYAPCMIINESA